MKNKTIIISAIILIILSCSNPKVKNKTSMVFSGRIENSNSDTLSLINNKQKTIFTFHLSDNRFSNTLDIEKGFYYLYDGKEQTQVYLEPNYNLNLSLNAKEFDETIYYKGKGANENNYLAQKVLLVESFGMKNYYGYYAKLDEKSFLKEADSLYKIELDFFNKHKDSLDKEFHFIEFNNTKYNYLYKIARYEDMKRFVTGNKEFKVSDNYPNIFNNIDLTNDSLLKSRSYLHFVSSYINKLTNNRIKGKESIDPQVSFLETVSNQINSIKLKERLAYNTAISRIGRVKELDNYYNQAISLIKDENYISELTEKYKKLKKISKGITSPDFELKDINGKTYTLNDFKGKYIYIDIWATWCLPCIKEIPALKELEKEYDNIQFISICKSDKKERWEKMVKDKELKGIQLFAPDENISFFKEYIVQGIPRFILIDDKGKIIDANATRPSNPDIRNVFDNLK